MSNLIKIEAKDDSVEIKYSPVRMAFNSFFSGIAWGVGSVIGATIIAALVFIALSKLDTIPVVGQYISDLLSYIQATAK